MLGTINQTIFQAIYGLSRRNFLLDDVGIFAAQYLIYILALGFLLLLYYQKSWRLRLHIFAEATIAILIGRGLITEIIRYFYIHPRPFEALGLAPLVSESGNSLPSGHAVIAFALSMTVWYVNRRWGVWYFIFSTIVGIARIYAGVHWPLDVVAGAALGIATSLIVHRSFASLRAPLIEPPSAPAQ